MAIFSPEVQITNTPLQVDGSGVTQPVSGTVSVGNFPAVQPVSDNGGSITVDGSVSVSNFPGGSVGSATVTSASVGAGAAVTLATSNVNRKRLILHNETGTLFVKLGTSASSASYTYRLTANTALEIDLYHGDVTAIKASGTSDVLVTEL